MRSFILLIAITLFIPAPALSESEPLEKISAGSKLEPYTFEDQHGVKKEIKQDTELVLMSFEMDLSKGIHKFLEEKEADYLDKHHAQYVIDISPMPSIITWLFAGPKMRKYPFPILLVDDEDFAPKYPKQEGKIVALKLDQDRTISDIRFFESMEEIDKEYFQEPKVSVTNLAEQAARVSKPSK